MAAQNQKTTAAKATTTAATTVNQADEKKAPDATTQTPDATTKTTASKKQAVLKIRSVPATFRRGGIDFTSKVSTHKVSDLTKDQIEAINAEKNLVVIEAEE